VFFEELSAFNGEQRKKQEEQQTNTHTSDGWTDDLVMDGDQEDED
jgi:hypothetical protein